MEIIKPENVRVVSELEHIQGMLVDSISRANSALGWDWMPNEAHRTVEVEPAVAHSLRSILISAGWELVDLGESVSVGSWKTTLYVKRPNR